MNGPQELAGVRRLMEGREMSEQEKDARVEAAAKPLLEATCGLWSLASERERDEFRQLALRALAAADAAQASADGEAEQPKAIQEAHRVAQADVYFKARAWMLDTAANRRLFEAGFDRGWVSGRAEGATHPAPAPSPLCQWPSRGSCLAWRREHPDQHGPAVPEGWKLVPVEPTQAMKKAAKKVDMDHGSFREWVEEDWPDHKRVWAAMLAAAPEAPAPAGKEGGND